MALRLIPWMLVLAAHGASAQNYRCQDANGHWEYRDRPCNASSVRQEPITVQRGRTAPAPRPAESQNIKDLTTMISAALAQGDIARAERLAVTERHWNMIRREKERAATTGALTPTRPAVNQFECERAMRNADTTASSLTARGSRNAIADREMNIKCYGTEQAGKIEKARAGAPRITINGDVAVDSGSHILHDQHGNTYTRTGGPTVIRQRDGRACQNVGGMIQCD